MLPQISKEKDIHARECVSTGALGARTLRSLGHHLLHPLFWDPELSRMHLQIQIPNAFPVVTVITRSKDVALPKNNLGWSGLYVLRLTFLAKGVPGIASTSYLSVKSFVNSNVARFWHFDVQIQFVTFTRNASEAKASWPTSVNGKNLKMWCNSSGGKSSKCPQFSWLRWT